MTLELHVWGPGFGLPSIDAQCLAAIAYFQQSIPRKEWTLLPTSNPHLSPTKALPALRHGEVWVGGFHSIVRYLDQAVDDEWSIDAELSEDQIADSIAFSAFVASQGLALLELSLYVSSQNYSVTRSEYSKLQPLPLRYLTPFSKREVAKNHAERLGLSELDMDNIVDDTGSGQIAIPSSLRPKRLTLSSILAKDPEIREQIKLDGLVTAFLEPLQNLRRGRDYCLSDTQFSSLDCETLGCLSLMIYPNLPQPWLKKIIEAKFPDMCAWARELKQDIFGPVFEPNDLVLRAERDTSEGSPKLINEQYMPWGQKVGRTVLDHARDFFNSAIDSIPILRYLRPKPYHHPGNEGLRTAGLLTWSWVSLWPVVGGSIALLAGYLATRGIVSVPLRNSHDQRIHKRLRDYGEAGAALGLYADQIAAHRENQAALERPNAIAPVEVDVDKTSA